MEKWPEKWREVNANTHDFVAYIKAEKRRDVKAWPEEAAVAAGLGQSVRYFAPANRKWPLLAVSVWKNYPKSPVDGIMVSFDYKTRADDGFCMCTLPPSLLPHLIEMLQRIAGT